ncbi:VOC family protein [Candidatus Babeliales bacterium]|nr:VOC family protein [Candidatus Babeliales bacterium]
MMKNSTPMLVVDSVEAAIKFYTEKLAFDIVESAVQKQEHSDQAFVYALLKKGRCAIMFRIPHIEELAEFSFIKRCASRCTGLYIEMKKGFDKYYQKCVKKGIPIVDELKEQPWGYRTFSIKDPFGLMLTFAQPIENFVAKDSNIFCGIPINLKDSTGTAYTEKELLDKMVIHLKKFGILRRAAKKYAKSWLKRHFPKK